MKLFTLILISTLGAVQSFCSWNNCIESSGSNAWCDANRGRCTGNCNGKWCLDAPAPTPVPAPRDAFCSWNGCTETKGSNNWCDANKGRCTGNCGGKWCPAIQGVVTTPAPTPKPTPAPTDKSDKVCKAFGWGDPHMITFDGLKFDAQARGEVILSKSLQDSGYMIQGRFEPFKPTMNGSPTGMYNRCLAATMHINFSQ